MERVLDVLLPGSGGLVHEPYNRHGGPGALDFWGSVAEVTSSARVLKHHPGSVLSDRQNSILYRRWTEAGGTIVHLTRSDLRAQATSLLIARHLNSYHRSHRVSGVDPDELEAELADLQAEVDHQSRVLASFPTVEVTYESVLDGPVDRRLAALAELAAAIAPELPDRLADCREQVVEIVGPGGQVRPSGEDDTVNLISQVPMVRGTLPLLSPDECRAWVQAAARRPGSQGERPSGVVAYPAVEIMGDSEVARLVASFDQRLRETRGIRLLPEEAESPVVVVYDGDHHPDHDLDLHHPLPSRRDIAMDFAVALSPDGSWAGGGVHLAGRGTDPESTRSGHAHYFSSAIGARRNPVTSGRLVSLVGRIPLAPGQILAPGQVLGDGDHWR